MNRRAELQAPFRRRQDRSRGAGMSAFAWLRSLVIASVIAAASLLPSATSSTYIEIRATPAFSPREAPTPVTFPQDDGRHQAPLEWWYYTGHLATAAGDDYGFEFVVFKGEVGGIGGLAAHFAVTDNVESEFHYDQRLTLDRERSAESGSGFDLSVGDWRMRGAGGEDHLTAAIPGYAISLDLIAEKPPALHDADGYIDYGEGEYSYYYSRPRLSVAGTLTLDGQVERVNGLAWMDHQWGDFSTFREGGWDWFSIQLGDGVDLMLYVVRDPKGAVRHVDASYIAADGTVSVLGERDFETEATGSWTSPQTGTTYPSGWTVEVPERGLALRLTPRLDDQELDARPTTGEIYWEGEVLVEGHSDGEDVSGVGYVELTGYSPGTANATPSTG